MKKLSRSITLLYKIFYIWSIKLDSAYHTGFILDNNTEARQTPLRKSKGRKINNEEEIKKLTFRLD